MTLFFYHKILNLKIIQLIIVVNLPGSCTSFHRRFGNEDHRTRHKLQRSTRQIITYVDIIQSFCYSLNQLNLLNTSILLSNVKMISYYSYLNARGAAVARISKNTTLSFGTLRQRGTLLQDAGGRSFMAPAITASSLPYFSFLKSQLLNNRLSVSMNVCLYTQSISYAMYECIRPIWFP